MFYFKDDKQITTYFADGTSAVWTKDDPAFEQVEMLCKHSNWIQIQSLHNQAKLLLTGNVSVNSDGNVVVGEAVLDSESSTLLSFIKLLKEKGVIDSEIEEIKPFLKNMFENPFIDAVTEIYDFCKAMDFEITDDGCFLAYKNVNADLSSIHDNGKTKHVIGEYTEVEAFDTDRHQTCSKGLHFCSKGYLSSYSGDTTIIVKVNPKDVVAIPVDYNNMKGRCRRYLTVGILGKDGDLDTTNIEAMTDNAIKTVKTEEAREEAKEKAKKTNRIEQTVSLMLVHNNDAEKVAQIMNITVSTVQRNMRKHRAEERNNEN